MHTTTLTSGGQELNPQAQLDSPQPSLVTCVSVLLRLCHLVTTSLAHEAQARTGGPDWLRPQPGVLNVPEVYVCQAVFNLLLS